MVGVLFADGRVGMHVQSGVPKILDAADGLGERSRPLRERLVHFGVRTLDADLGRRQPRAIWESVCKAMDCRRLAMSWEWPSI